MEEAAEGRRCPEQPRSPARPVGGCRAAGAAAGSALIAINECHRQKEKQKLPPKIAQQNLARLLKTPISKG